MHTISGMVEAPDACTAASSTAVLTGDASDTQAIRVDITMPADTGICLQVPTTLKYSTTIAAPANLPISATVNGAAASTTDS
jgi:hypothetical protein